MSENLEFDYTLFDDSYVLPLMGNSSKTKEQILLMATVAFAKKGYAAVSMRDLAKLMGINQSTIYCHFQNKEALWKNVIKHAGDLYLLYFEHLDEKLSTCSSFEEALEAIFYHPKRLLNIFSCYAYSLLQTEQFRDLNAGRMFEEIFMTYAVDFLEEWLNKFIARGLVRDFDSKTVAIIIVHSMLMGLQTEVHLLLGHKNKSPYNPREMIQLVQNFINWSVRTNDAVENG